MHEVYIYLKNIISLHNFYVFLLASCVFAYFLNPKMLLATHKYRSSLAALTALRLQILLSLSVASYAFQFIVTVVFPFSFSKVTIEYIFRGQLSFHGWRVMFP